MMKLALFVFLAVLAYASAGLVAVGPSTYTAEGVQQIHSPWAVSSSSRVQSYNDAAILTAVPVPVSAYGAVPVNAYGAGLPLAYGAGLGYY